MSNKRNTFPTRWANACIGTCLYLAILCFSFPLFAQNPSLSIGLAGVDAASNAGCGYMDRLYVLQVQNATANTYYDIDCSLPLGSTNQLGDALIDVISVAVLDNLTDVTSLEINNTFDAVTQSNLCFIDSLLPNQSISILLRVEVNPNTPGLLGQPGIQASLFGGLSPGGNSILLDHSDGGFLYHFSSNNIPGDTGGDDDPLMFGLDYLNSQLLNLNDNINISVGPNCAIDWNIDMIAENPTSGTTEADLPLGGYYDYTLYSNSVQVIEDEDIQEHMGETILVNIIHVLSCASYWTQVTINDFLPPVFQEIYTTDTVSCFMDFNEVPPPIAVDNCSEVTYHLVQQQFIDENICDDQTELVRRTWLSMDAGFNESAPAIQDIYIIRDYEIDFPDDVLIECSAYALDQSLTDASTASAGVPSSTEGESLTECNYSYVYSDQVIPTCANSFKIFRTWTVLDWCTGTIINSNTAGEDNFQIIEVRDTQAPTIVVPNFTLSATENGNSGSFSCYSLGYIPAPFVTDECNAFEIYVITPVGEAVYLNGIDAASGALVPEPGLGLGVHEIVFQALDMCGNVSEESVLIEVIDDVTPTMICDELTQVALNNQGIALVDAINLDDGSFDNCCISGFDASQDNGLNYSETLSFDCTHVGDTIDVQLRLTDCFGNSNQCNVLIMVEDLIPPVAFAPQNNTITCLDYYESILPALEQSDWSVLAPFGIPQYYDNCFVELSEEVSWAVDNCGIGIITRTWFSVDEFGNSGNTIQQEIEVVPAGDWSVTFPEDIVLDCDTGVDLDDMGQPDIQNASCFQIATAVTDQVFEFPGGACKTIFRNWSVINWCTFPDEPAITHTQVIEIMDTEAPVFESTDYVYSINSNTCDAFVDISINGVEDCSDSITVIYDLPFENQSNWPIGVYDCMVTVSDWCNNQNTQTFLVEVVDDVSPVAVVQDHLIIDLGGETEVEVHANTYDISSYDVCTPVTFSFSSNPSDLSITVDCDDLGILPIEVWVHDENGNASWVQVILEVTDNMGGCQSNLILQGNVSMASGLALPSVELWNVQGWMLDLTDIEGNFDTEVVADDQYVEFVAPYSNLVNGVTTLDLVAISKHILNMQAFNSSYQYWAADVNGSGTVTTLDMVFIQKVILGMLDEFPIQKNWRFFINENATQPWSQEEKLVLSSLSTYQDIDVVGVKLGDVNFSAQPE